MLKKEFRLLFSGKLRLLLFLLLLGLCIFLILSEQRIIFSKVLEDHDLAAIEGPVDPSRMASCSAEVIAESIGYVGTFTREQALNDLDKVYCQTVVYGRERLEKELATLKQQLEDGPEQDAQEKIQKALQRGETLLRDMQIHSVFTWSAFYDLFGTSGNFFYEFYLAAILFLSFPLVTYEKSCRMTRLLFNTKHGSKTLLLTKFKALLLTSVGSALALFIFGVLVFFYKSYETIHWRLDYSEAFFTVLPYRLSLAGLVLILALFWILSAIQLSSFLLLFSTLAKEGLHALILAFMTLLFLPSLLATIGVKAPLLPSLTIAVRPFFTVSPLTDSLLLNLGLLALLPLCLTLINYRLAKALFRRPF